MALHIENPISLHGPRVIDHHLLHVSNFPVRSVECNSHNGIVTVDNYRTSSFDELGNCYFPLSNSLQEAHSHVTEGHDGGSQIEAEVTSDAGRQIDAGEDELLHGFLKSRVRKVDADVDVDWRCPEWANN